MDPKEIFSSSNGSADFVSFEELTDMFKTPSQRQSDYEPKPDTSPGSGTDDLGRLADPDGSAREPEELEAATVVDHEHAMRTGERIARIIDTGIDFTLSNFVARNGESYRADERDLQDIAEAWGEVSEEHNWNIGPEWTLVILYMMVYGPLVKQAIADRKMAELEARQSALAERQAALEAQMRIVQMNQPATQPTPDHDGTHIPDPTTAPGATGSPFNYQPNA